MIAHLDILGLACRLAGGRTAERQDAVSQRGDGEEFAEGFLRSVSGQFATRAREERPRRADHGCEDGFFQLG